MQNEQTDLTSKTLASNDSTASAVSQIHHIFKEALAIVDQGTTEERIDLAEWLVTSNASDRSILFRLAKDDIEVAAPILEHFPFLREKDQLALARGTSECH